MHEERKSPTLKSPLPGPDEQCKPSRVRRLPVGVFGRVQSLVSSQDSGVSGPKF